MNNKAPFLVTLFFAAACLGCSSGHVGSSGKVVFSDDGSPVTFGTVMFATPTFQAKGDINKDGTFKMGSYGAADGLPTGSYKVAIIGVIEETDDGRFYSLLDPKWTGPATTEFTVDVEKTTKNLVIKVDRNPETLEQFKSKK